MACGAAPPSQAPIAKPGPPRLVRYTFALDRALEHMETTVCFEGGSPDALVAIHDAARARIEGAELIRNGRSVPLPYEGRIELQGVRPGECVRYRSDVSPDGRRSSGAPGSYRVGADLVSPTGVWLWAPEPRTAETRILARFVMPEGMRASTLWPDAEDGNGWMRIEEPAFRYLAYVAFGDLEIERVPVPGGCIEAALLDGALEVDAEGRERWLGAAGRAVSRVLGRFPAERTSVIVVPTPFADTPVLFGIVGRGLLPTVALLVGENASADALEADWTAIHEFTHLASPYVERDEAWITEGLATYYQNVLRAREGLLTPEQAWSEMTHGFARGRSDGTGRTLDGEAREVGTTFAYGRVYWAGAAIAMLSDVEYRRRSGGTDSLDHAMVRAADLRERTLRASELVRAMDGAPDGVMAGVVERWLASAEFPDVDATLAWLGVVRGDRGVSFVEAPGAEVRDAIMNEGAPLASNPPGCD